MEDLMEPPLPGTHERSPNIREIEQEIAVQEKMLTALEEAERFRRGYSTFSPERLQAMREALESKRRHLQELISKEWTRNLSPLEYDTEVGTLMQGVTAVERNLSLLSNADRLEASDLDELHRTLDQYQEKLQELDEKTDNPTMSTERWELVDLITTIRRRYPRRFMEEEKKMLSGAEYEERVGTLMQGVTAVERNLSLLSNADHLEQGDLDELHGTLDQYQEKLQELDEQTKDPSQSADRRELMTLINSIRRQYPRTMLEAQKASLSGVRDLHQKVKSTYASISHTLTQEQRQAYRVRIAQAAALVRRAESQEYFASPTFVRAAASLAIARATALAPTLAAAVYPQTSGD